MSRNYPLRDPGVTFLWVLLLPSSVSVSPDLLKRPFCGVLAPPLWPLSFCSHRLASTALIQHHRPRRRDVRADRRHHLFVCYHHHCCVPLHLNLVQGGALSKALDEIYKIYTLLQFWNRSALKNWLNFFKHFRILRVLFSNYF